MNFYYYVSLHLKQTNKQPNNRLTISFYILVMQNIQCLNQPHFVSRSQQKKTREDRNNLVATRFACELLSLWLWLLVHCLVLPDYSWFYSIIKHWLVIENCFIWPWTKSGNSYSISRLSRKKTQKKKKNKKKNNKQNKHAPILFSYSFQLIGL